MLLLCKTQNDFFSFIKLWLGFRRTLFEILCSFSLQFEFKKWKCTPQEFFNFITLWMLKNANQILPRYEFIHYHVDIYLKLPKNWNEFDTYIFSFSGQPVLVEVSISLRNILEIDEHKQVNSFSPFFSCPIIFFAKSRRRENFFL